MSLTAYRTLGRSGLIVSPLALGTMTFGAAGWGAPDAVSKAIFHAYVDAGGNFIDTADVYGGGRSEELLGGYIADRGLRDRLALATKFAFHGGEPGNPNAGDNGRKNIYRALEGSLRRLRTDYVDLYWLHVWDSVTPVEEVLQSLGDLVRAGKIRYFGFSNVPAWYVARAATLAETHSIPGPVALQLEYSLVERGIEREHLPAARECGLGVCPWSPLVGGFLAGKYRREGEGKGPRVRAGSAATILSGTGSSPTIPGACSTPCVRSAARSASRWRGSPSPGPRRNPASPRLSWAPARSSNCATTWPRWTSASPPRNSGRWTSAAGSTRATPTISSRMR